MLNYAKHALDQLEDLCCQFGVDADKVARVVWRAWKHADAQEFVVVVWTFDVPIEDTRARDYSSLNWQSCDKVVAIVRNNEVKTITLSRSKQLDPCRVERGFQSPESHFGVQAIYGR